MVVLKQRPDQSPLLIRQIRWVGLVRHRASSWIPLHPLPDQQLINLKPHAAPSLKFGPSSTQHPLRARSCLPCDRVMPGAAMSPGSRRRTISSTSTLRLEPSIPVLTRRKTNFTLSPQPLKHTAGHSLLSTTPPFP